MNVLAELERCGLTYQTISEKEVGLQCPFHEDRKASLSLNTENRFFKCHASSCGKSGDIITLLARVLNTTREVINVDLANRYGWKTSRTIDIDVVDKYHSAIDKAGPLLLELRKRGITKSIIKERKLGFDKKRIIIPIFDEYGNCVNLRKYLPGAPSAQKMKGVARCNQARLYPIDQLKYSTIVLCGGEMKALIAAHYLNQHDIGAITATAGEGNWKSELTPYLKDKKVYVCFDIDEGGRKGAERICQLLYNTVSSIHAVRLPLDEEDYPNGDLNDYFTCGYTDSDFLSLLQKSKEYKPEFKTIEDEAPTSTTLDVAVTAQYATKRVQLNAVVSAIDTTPYSLPKLVKPNCERNSEFCGSCPVNFLKDTDTLELHRESPEFLEMVDASKNTVNAAIRKALQIPPCKKVTFTVLEYYTAENIRISPRLEITNNSHERVLQPAIFLGTNLESNEAYSFIGRPYPNPRTQQNVLLFSKGTLLEDTLSHYTIEDTADLKVFQPKDWTMQGIQDKLDEIYTDLSRNVTRIYERQDMHLVFDLVYHSALFFPFAGNEYKGWAEALILGDSSQGKSETSLQLMKHYGLGEKFDCKNATVAGLLGGLQQLGNKWFVTWGIIPTHDKRLIVLEEVKGATTELISKLTDMRSSGIAEIPKIEKRRTLARTRLVFISNPRSDQSMEAYNYGVDAVRELIGQPEDIRRFDLAIVVSANQIDPRVISKIRDPVPHIYTSELCRKLILFGWTRKTEQIRMECTERVLDLSNDLCDSFDESIPLVDRGSMRLKLARLAVGLAVRTGSIEDDSIIVRDCHAEYIHAFIKRIYSNEEFGYDDYSEMTKRSNSLLNEEYLVKRLESLPFPKDFIESMLATHEIELRDISDWCGWDRPEAIDLVSFLVRKHALIRHRYCYLKTPGFIKLLKRVRKTVKDRPEHIEEKGIEF